MPTHTVKQGESLNGIALKYGFEWKKLWDLSENQALKEKRGDPNVLLEGDEVFYPEKEKKNESGGTEACHSFKLPGVPFELRLELLNADHEPLKDAEWYCEIDGKATEPKKTGSDGKVLQKLPARASNVKLFVNGFEFPLKLRHLDPANTVTGIQQRLANLGYEPGAIDGILGPNTRASLARFQLDYADADLQPTGYPDEKTVKHLRLIHENVEDDQHNALDDAPPAPAGLSGDDPPGAQPQPQEDKTDAEHDLPPPDYSDEMALGSDASRPMSIACLQTMLTNLGYDPGPIDNLDGPKTRSGVKAFQADNQVGHALAIDGIAGPLTRTALRKVYDNG